MKLPIPRHLESVPADASAEADVDEQLLRIFFDQMPMGIAVFGTDACLQRCSKSWTAFFVNYLGVDESYVAPGASIFDLIPGNEEALRPLLEGVLAGNVVRQQAHRLEKDDIVTYWDVVFAPMFADGQVVGFVDIVTDATERRLAYEALEIRVSVLARLASAMTVDQSLEVTIRQATAAAVEATSAVASASFVQPSEDGAVPLCATTGLPDGYAQALLASWERGAPAPHARAAAERQQQIIRGAAARVRDDARYARLHPLLDGTWEDVVVLPIAAASQPFGWLSVHYPGGYDFEDELPTLQAIADLAAAALENARLYGQAEQHAADLERQRLARELHDSVSQALFSMTMHARTAQRLLARLDLPEGEQVSGQVARLAELTTGALAEMRALIFELRPGAVTEEGLAAALTRQTQAISARTGLPITVQAPAERIPLPAGTEEHLYRIALEALNNAVKHARADSLTVDLTVDPAEGVVLRVVDDGVGFDPDAAHPGHLGQHTMRERATAIGAVLNVTSSPGAGATVEVRVPVGP
jgi:signal transduction histidine kinase